MGACIMGDDLKWAYLGLSPAFEGTPGTSAESAFTWCQLNDLRCPGWFSLGYSCEALTMLEQS
eukprot:78031-Pelagomonas_calceolata.AAC.3